MMRVGDGVTEVGEELEEQSCKFLRTQRGKEEEREREGCRWDEEENRHKIFLSLLPAVRVGLVWDTDVYADGGNKEVFLLSWAWKRVRSKILISASVFALWWFSHALIFIFTAEPCVSSDLVIMVRVWLFGD